MSQIRCPHCNQVFTIDKSEYQELLSQVRNETLKQEVDERASQIELSYQQKEKVALSEQETKHQKELNELHNKLKDAENKINEANDRQRIAVLQKEQDEEKKRQELLDRLKEAENKLNQQKAQAENEIKIAVLEKQREEEEKQRKLEEQLKEANFKLNSFDEAKKNEMALASERQKAELEKLRGELSAQKAESELEKKKIQETHEIALRLKDEQIAQYRDFKLSLSTKMIGESLEQYCYTEFNKVRMTAFPKAYFEKDNDASGGTKGDFIYRETDENGVEILSIMFEMKNETDTSATRHRNEDFLDKLNKDREEKRCEYAVLVSMLEPENDYYNAGIVDVSYRHPKMYVIRPQCFIPMITILRNAASNALQARQELALVKQEQIDVTHFEEKLDDFKGKIGRNFELAAKKYDAAIEDIDKAIKALQKMREDLLSSKDHLRIGTDQTQGITIRKLTNGNPTMKKLFDEAADKRDNTFDTTAEEE